jgi:hypothetical protein
LPHAAAPRQISSSTERRWRWLVLSWIDDPNPAADLRQSLIGVKEISIYAVSSVECIVAHLDGRLSRAPDPVSVVIVWIGPRHVNRPTDALFTFRITIAASAYDRNHLTGVPDGLRRADIDDNRFVRKGDVACPQIREVLVGCVPPRRLFSGGS